MGILSGFSGWINQKKQKRKADSKRETDPEEAAAKPVGKTYPRDMEETKKQLKLWKASEKKSPWHDLPPKLVKLIKVDEERNKNQTLMVMRFTIGLPPEAVYDMFTSYEEPSYFEMMKRPHVLKHISAELTGEDAPKLKLKTVRKSANWKFLCWSGKIPVELNFTEYPKDFFALYGPTKKLKFMKDLTGRWQIEPFYLDNDPYCKPRLPKNREEYKKCTHGKGRISSNVTVRQIYKPDTFYRLPPLYWLINRATVKTTKAIAEEFQIRAAVIRGV